MLLAADLDTLNRQRQSALETMLTEARGLLRSRIEQRVAVIAGDGWRPGLVGLVAGRLAEEMGKPTIVITRDGPQARGSARGHAGFNVTAALAACQQLLIRYGGHQQAAGLTLASDQIEALAASLDTYAQATWPDGLPDDCVTVAGAPRLADLRPADVAELAAMEPFGEGNPEPLWLLRDLRLLEARAVGRDGSHLRLVVTDDTATRTAIAFRQGARRAELLTAQRLDALCMARLSTWQGAERVELQVRDIRPAAG
jgi:single-stranded-DNA-specific exonuclease